MLLHGHSMTTVQTTIFGPPSDKPTFFLQDHELRSVRLSEGSSSSGVSTASSLSSFELEILNSQSSNIAGTRPITTTIQPRRSDVRPSSTTKVQVRKDPTTEEKHSYLKSPPYYERESLREKFAPRSLLKDYAWQAKDDYSDSHRTAKKLLIDIRRLFGAFRSICPGQNQRRQSKMSLAFPIRWRDEHDPQDAPLPRRFLGLQPKSPKPKVIVLMLQDRTFIDSYMYKRMRHLLHHFAEVDYCSDRAECNKACPGSCPPQAVLVVDAGLTQNREMTSFCASYMRCGGRLIFAANFANYMPTTVDVRRFFMEFSCPWSFDEVKQSLSAEVNRALGWKASEKDESPGPDILAEHLPRQISFRRTQTLQGVKREFALYQIKDTDILQEARVKTAPNKVVEKEQFRESFDRAAFDSTAKEAVTEHLQWTVPARIKTPVAWATRKKGYIGVVCDMNMQEDTELLILVMMGLVADG